MSEDSKKYNSGTHDPRRGSTTPLAGEGPGNRLGTISTALPPTPGVDNESYNKSRRRKNLLLGLSFIGPNVIGFLAFTSIPLVISLIMAFTNWNMKLHNAYKDHPLTFVGLDNFRQLFSERYFWQYLGNTLFLMMAMPFAIAISLLAAMLLSRELSGGSKKGWLFLIGGAMVVGGCIMLAAVGAGAGAFTLLLIGIAGVTLLSGTAGGNTLYRTLFYIPHFTAGVATFILWKKLYAPEAGPIANMVATPLLKLSEIVRQTSEAPSFLRFGDKDIGPVLATNINGQLLWNVLLFVLLAAAAWVLWASLSRIRKMWLDGDVGPGAAVWSGVVLLLPAMVVPFAYGSIISLPDPREKFFAGVAERVYQVGSLGITHFSAYSLLTWAGIAFTVVAVAALVTQFLAGAKADRTFVARGMSGFGTGAMFAAAAMVLQFVLIGLAAVCFKLPAWTFEPVTAGGVLETPKWLLDPSFAKPAIMFMGLWGAIGGNTMLLYLAALTNVPQDLYEAADIDGAGRFGKFWNVTWPQLAPTTFFVVVMGMIGGLQGGFEMARIMTQGGPAGQTTTLAYFIYTEGFETGRLGYASAISWALFGLVFFVTLFNWRFGNKLVND